MERHGGLRLAGDCKNAFDKGLQETALLSKCGVLMDTAVDGIKTDATQTAL
jgi:hypothetical protein